jgi:hypothetical protein
MNTNTYMKAWDHFKNTKHLKEVGPGIPVVYWDRVNKGASRCGMPIFYGALPALEEGQVRQIDILDLKSGKIDTLPETAIVLALPDAKLYVPHGG